ncbi:MAG: RNA-binding cell elongation regulator Jag/EloR [Actinomycetota bacterium]
MREVERSAASVEEAVEAALGELGASEQEADIEIVQEPKGGFLGLGGHQAVVRVRLKGAPEPVSEEDLDDQADVAAEFLEHFLDLLGIPGDAEPRLSEGTMYVDVWGEEGGDTMGLLIGRHGQTLDALQEVVRSVVQRRVDARCRVVVDVEDYRKRRRSQLVSRARGIARRVKRTGRPERLEPMNAFERKIVHDAVTAVGGIETGSEGEDPDRRVVIRRAQSARRA